MRIYTRQGDKGQTTLFDGTRVSKCNLRLHTYGTLDELNSMLGIAAAMCVHPDLRALLESLQQQLFDLGADLATPVGSKNAAKVRRFTTEDAAALEPQIDAAAARLPPLKTFVLPGGSVLAAQLHVARTVCRRAERHLVELMEREEVGPGPLVYLNRLSDLLFMLARLANQLEGVPDVAWQMQKPAKPPA